MSALLVIDEARVTYHRGRVPIEAVRGVSLELNAGQRLGLVGESGSGKSSLARAAVGLERLTSGRITFDGVPVERAPTALRRRFQPVFQDSSAALDPRLTIAETLGEPLEVHALGSDAERAARIAEVLDVVQLPRDVLSRRPRALSAGQRQRVNLARALVLDPEVLVLDEPVSSLDVSVQAQVLNLLDAQAKERQLALLFISHDLDVVAHLCTTIAVMYGGQIVELGASEAVLARPRHPYTQLLLGRQPVEVGEASAPRGCAFAGRCPLRQDRCLTQAPTLSAEPHRVACFVAPPCSG